MSLTKYAGIMVIVWVFCLDRIPECSNYGELANSLYLVRKQNKKKMNMPIFLLGSWVAFQVLLLVGLGTWCF